MRPALLAAFLLVSAPSGAQVAERLDDLRLATAVRIALVEDARTRPLDVTVSARGGVVAVEGEVPAADRSTVDAVARAVPGVRSLAGSDAPAGPVVAIPPRPAAPVDTRPAEGGEAYHVVRPGDTLFSLARRYNTTVDEVLRLNGLRSPSIAVGQRLRVR